MKRGSKDMNKLPKKIRIVKASFETYWYADCIGMVLGVVGTSRGRYSTDYKNKNGLYMVVPKDCEVVEE
ncbi:hypothetical protein SAMN05660297_02771 [Natronincola peptidivorans]|uniref:Uncharacterized protein n=1 Tax=Natronincola peptidivorans TaxID=426128 RepID=A0A1I0FDX6_9FIRM|nr:hypothetical protein [Natronincola peptidivorans]SET56167.1 hypothetical protein SAMN05660297_02771 [Natronincola peptidivorans]